eukprot:TRINITY_DN3091_c0_g4_i1.p1 TRINITY_DN3091_c0_g4~~TRINITY_DN3091_c0_g4_i1.p1  ORF type:complete len:407 (+),score=71.00 TRINITY_DN3091_c0_g4_i1:43-1263(+)
MESDDIVSTPIDENSLDEMMMMEIPPPPFRPRNESCVVNLTWKLLHTYKKINQIYFDSLKTHDDNDNYLIVHTDDILVDRYEIKSILGRGSFGVTVKAYDRNTKGFVAVKILRSGQRFNQQGTIEINIMKYVNLADESDKKHFIELNNSFYHMGHLCIVTELLHSNLYWALKVYTKMRGFKLEVILGFAYQLLESLSLMSSLDPPVIHCDLKPENILMVRKINENDSMIPIKLIDFGSSCTSNKILYSYVQSRYYRAPEIVLQSHDRNYTPSVDMWSLGCVLVELYIGKPLFPGKTNAQMMQLFVSVLGHPPQTLLNKSKKFDQFYNKDFTPTFELFPSKSLKDILKVSPATSDNTDLIFFYNMVTDLLQFEPSERITPDDCLVKYFNSTPPVPTITSINQVVNFG